MLEGRVARLLEIVEREFMQLAGYVAGGKERADEILRSIGRARVANYPAVNVIGNRAETALKIGHLVLDDHIQAETFCGTHSLTLDSTEHCEQRLW
ncbi:hypothetical protein [Mesorhizobium argentiipisi]|uniref:hypothetical protein n=1 Tax=Mesorhizobium argentiipisi TaxID=3015175 RepID=UPI00301D77C4